MRLGSELWKNAKQLRKYNPLNVDHVAVGDESSHMVILGFQPISP